MKTILIYSGGLDSTCLLFDLIKKGHQVECLSFNYGQRHKKELLSAHVICTDAKIPMRVVDLQSLQPLLRSSQTSPEIEVPEGRYDAPNMKLTVVPNRNMIMLSIAVGHAISREFYNVAFAAHAGDHTIYPDCRPAFVGHLQAVVDLCDWYTVKLLTPFLYLTKGGCVKEGVLANAPIEKTWSCYKGLDLHCGVCGACVERIEAMQEAGVIDPTKYAPATLPKAKLED